MGFLNTFASTLAATAAIVSAQHDAGAKIDKPPLYDNLNALRQGLIDHLPETNFRADLQAAGTIPKGCHDIAAGQVDKNVNFDPALFDVFNVVYDDCANDLWVFCHHKQSPVTIDSMARQFGKLPIQMQQWVRHVVDIPDEAGHAFEFDGSVTFFNPKDDMLPVFIHETGHSLDLMGAYGDSISSSDAFFDALSKDTHVPDTYAATNAIEDVAQNTVVAVFNENYPGGFGAIEPNYGPIQYQYFTVIGRSIEADQGNNLFNPGQNAQCTHRMPPSEPVPIGGAKTRSLHERRGAPPVIGLSNSVKTIESRREGKDKIGDCSLTW